jgi:hypothetical protein
MPTVLSPLGAVEATESCPAATLARLDGARVGFLDNSKLNSQVLLEQLAFAMARERGVTPGVSLTKPTAAGPMSDADFDRLVANCDAVVTGVGD